MTLVTIARRPLDCLRRHDFSTNPPRINAACVDLHACHRAVQHRNRESGVQMPDLYRINLHIQERLEHLWQDEVVAVEAARWLDEAGLLPDRKGGLPLRNLLRNGRIAGQQQRPDQKGGRWTICRLAESSSPEDIRRARERLRLYLPIERANFPAGWPVHHDVPVFWQELGKTIAAFGYLEKILADTCYCLLAAGTGATELAHASEDKIRRWRNRVLRSQTDSLRGLTIELDRVLKEDGRVSFHVRERLVDGLEELRPFRNAVCHGAWLGIDEDGSGSFHHLYKDDGFAAAFKRRLGIRELADMRARAVDLTFRIAEAASVAGAGFALATVMARKYEPRNAPSSTAEPDGMRSGSKA